MKAEVKKIDSSNREISIGVNGDIVRNKFEDVFKRIAKEAKVAGFRPGNVPRDILERHYASNAHEQVLKELIPDVYNDAVNETGLDVVGLPQISDVKLDRNKLSFKAIVEIMPEITIKNYRGIKVNFKNISVTPDEIKRNIDSLKEVRKIDSVDDSFAKGLGYPNLLELERALERQIFLQRENDERQRIENEIIDYIIKDLDFKIPESLVKRQLEDLVRQAKVNLALKGLPREKIDEQEAQILKELNPAAEKQVKVYLVLAAIAKKENITLDDNMPRRAIEFLLREADWQVSN
jgi:FKBP-type peptidyl-prolyl cis-trans isomerase (trigger factor)